MIQPVVVGLDHDSKGFHAVVFGAEVRWRSFASKEMPEVRRLEACLNFDAFLDEVPAKAHLFAEEPLILQKNGKTTRLLALMAGALWARTLRRDLFWHWVDVAHWKREIVGNGNASKEQVAEWVRHVVTNMEPPDRLPTYEAFPDLFDAHCLAVYGRRAVPNMEVVT